MTDPLGQSQVLPYIEGLSKKGYSFSLISFEKPLLFEKRKEHIEMICERSGIEWIPLTYTKKPPVLSTVWDVVKLNRAVKKQMKSGIELIHCRSYIPSLVALHIKRKFNIPFIFDMRGFWADERADGGIWNMDRAIFKAVYSYFKKKERAFISESTHMVSLTENGKKEMLEWGIEGLNDSHISVIPCSADFNLFECSSMEKKKAAKVRLGLSEDTPVLSYMGSLGTWYLFDDMIDYFVSFRKRNSGAKFLILTQHDQDEVRFHLMEKNIPDDDVILTFASREELPSYMHASDHSVFFIQQSYSKKSSSPTKMGELLAMGIPVVANNQVGDVEEVVKDLDVGVVVNSLDANGYDEALNLMGAYESTDPQVIRSRSKDYYDLDNGVEQYFKIYQSTIG